MAQSKSEGAPYAAALFELAWANQQEGNVEAALRHYMDAKVVYENAGVFEGPQYALLLKTIGYAHVAQGHNDVALQWYAEAKVVWEATCDTDTQENCVGWGWASGD